MNAPAPELAAEHDGMDRVLASARTAFWRSKRGLLAAGLVLILATIAAYAALPSPGSLIVAPTQVQVTRAAKQQFNDYLPLRAEAAALHSEVITSESGGQVREILVPDGAYVTAGQAIGRLSNQQLELAVAQQQVEIASKLAVVTDQEQGAEKSRLETANQIAEAANDRMRADHDLAGHEHLYKLGVISEAAIRLYRSDSAYRREKVKSLTEGQRTQAQMLQRERSQLHVTSDLLRRNLLSLQRTLDGLILRAPLSGTLTGFAPQLGQAIQAGETVGQVIQGNGYKLTAAVDEFYLGRVQIGRQAVATIDGKRFDLHVTSVIPRVTEGRFKIELAFARAAPASLRAGQAVDLQLRLGEPSTATVVPAGPWADAGNTAFVAQDSSSRFERRDIRIGRRTPEQVEILSGISPGEKVIVSSTKDYQSLKTIQLR